MPELVILTSGKSPEKLLATGKKKGKHTVIANATLIEDEKTYKVTLKIEGPDDAMAKEILGTTKLGEAIEMECTPESPE